MLRDYKDDKKTKTVDQTTQYRKTNHGPIHLILTSINPIGSQQLPATHYMIDSCSDVIRHHKFKEDRMIKKTMSYIW